MMRTDSPMKTATHEGAVARRVRYLGRLARVAENTESIVILTDLEGTIEWVNDSFTRVSGYTASEAIGRKPGELLQGAETNRAETARIGAALRDRQTVSAELLNYTKQGRPYWVGMKIAPLTDEDGSVDGFMAIQADITERREQRLAHQRLTDRLNFATAAAQVGMFELGVDGSNLWWNDMMYEILGQERTEVPPTIEQWHAMVHPEDLAHVIAGRQQRVTSGVTLPIRYRIVRPDGSVRHVESIGSAIRPDDTSTPRIGGVLLDITDRVLAEERESELQRRLRDTSHQAGMAEIATGVLHNVGNVLNSLGIANSTVREEFKSLRLDRLEQSCTLLQRNQSTLATFLTEERQGRALSRYLPELAAHIAAHGRALLTELDAMESLVVHLREIVNAQQSLARIGGTRELTDLREVLESALLVQAPELASIEVQRLYDDLPPVSTDRHKLMQIIVNLLANARDAIRGAAERPGRIVVRLHRVGQHAVIDVEDSGIGMSSEVLSRLWRFGFTTKKTGHGFGLHHCANAAREIGATIDATSDGAGQGSRFTLRLPLEESGQRSAGVAA